MGANDDPRSPIEEMNPPHGMTTRQPKRLMKTAATGHRMVCNPTENDPGRAVETMKTENGHNLNSCHA